MHQNGCSIAFALQPAVHHNGSNRWIGDRPTHEVNRYEKTLIAMNADARKAWSDKVSLQLLKCLTDGDEVILLAGEAYREFLVPPLRAEGFNVRIPMEGLRIGQQLNWLDNPQGIRLLRHYASFPLFFFHVSVLLRL